MNQFKKGYDDALCNTGALHGSLEGSEYIDKVNEAIDSAVAALQKEATHRANVSDDYLKGWLAEQWHTETLKISAQTRDRPDIWASVQGNNRPGEDIRYGDLDLLRTAEVKYYKSGEATARAISRPEYQGRTKIIPADQKETVRSAAEKLAQKNRDSRPAQASRYEDTAHNVDDRLRLGDVASKPLAEADMKQIARGLKRDGDIDRDQYNLNAKSFVEWSDIARQSGEAALHAAILSAALSAAPHIWKTLNEYMESGDVNPEVLADRGRTVLSSSSTAGLRGGVAAGLTAACDSGLLGSSLKGVSPFAIGMATAMAINAIGYAIQLEQGKLSRQEFAHNCLRDTFALSAGLAGAAIGQFLIPAPVFGALAGNLVGSTLGAVAFEGANELMIGICADAGWTFFDLVDQDYVVPEEILRGCGYDFFTNQSFQTQSFSTSSFRIRSFSSNSLSFHPVRRGIIKCTTIGYIYG